MGNGLREVVWTLAIALFGGLGASWAGLPAAALIGSTLAVSIVSLCRLPTRVPSCLRNMAFAAIGCSLGSGVNADILALAARWPLSLLGLVAAMLAIYFSTIWMLTALFGQSRETALLGASPGAMSYSMALAASGIGDAAAVGVIQGIRLLMVTVCLPPILTLTNLSPSGSILHEVVRINPLATMVLFALSLATGFLLGRLRLPASYLIAGILVSGTAHFLGLVAGRPQSLFLFCGLIVTGSVVGSRFSCLSLADLRRLLGAALTTALASSALAAMLAWIASWLLHLPFGQVWVAYAPGGVEAMAAMAFSLGYDSTYVAAHHLCRIILLLFLLPLLLKGFPKTGAPAPPSRPPAASDSDNLPTNPSGGPS